MPNGADTKSSMSCWICGCGDLRLRRPSQIVGPLGSSAFRITDSHYGQTASIYQCQRCRFMQCDDMNDVLQYYEQMDDEGYEETREARALQMRKLIDLIHAV